MSYIKEKIGQSPTVYWYSKENKKHHIPDMSTSYILNCISFLKKGGASDQIEALPFLEKELLNRKNGADILEFEKRDMIPYFYYYNTIFTHKFIQDNETKIDWDLFIKTQELDSYVLKKYEKKLNWGYIFRHKVLPNDYVNEKFQKLDWSEISCNENYPEFFLEEWFEFIDVKTVFRRRKLSSKFLMKFGNEVDYQTLFSTQRVPEELIEKNFDKLEKSDPGFWNVIFSTIIFSEDFLERNKNRIKWDVLSYHIYLYDINLIYKFEYRINWKKATVSGSFPEEIYERHKGEIMWESICTRQPLSFEFIIRNKKYIQHKWVSKQLEYYFGNDRKVVEISKGNELVLPSGKKIVFKNISCDTSDGDNLF